MLPVWSEEVGRKDGPAHRPAMPSPRLLCSSSPRPSPWPLPALSPPPPLPCNPKAFSLFSPLSHLAFRCCLSTRPAPLGSLPPPRPFVLQVSQPRSPLSPQGSPVYEEGDDQNAKQGEAAHQSQHLQGGKVVCRRESELQQERFGLDSRRKNLLIVNQ